ncbi:hypothetical protein KKD19_01565 [Patescibacteria group bacterium]|nr:hypothetical protein [Patescibacteria group bacterium]MBU4511918.1 hypothetical protein [Patescibacteria group bacterium]MCG2692886.1 hypothetical protein [Candidatus Parcubacteria bacterium]
MQKEDLKQIKGIFDESFEDGVIKYIKPSFDDVYKKIDHVEQRLEKKIDHVEQRLEKKIDHVDNQMVTKDYLDEKLADLKGDTVVRDRKIDEKALIANRALRRKGLLVQEEERRIIELKIFPTLDDLKPEAVNS